MRSIFILLAAFMPVLSTAQVPYIQWKKCFGSTAADYGKTIIQTSDGGFVLGAMSISTTGQVTGNHGGADFWIVRMNDTGAILWAKCYGGSSSDNLMNIQQTADGGFIAVGNTSSNDSQVSGNHGMSDVWVLKISDTGLLQWQKCLGGSGMDKCNYVQQTADGGYILTGGSNSSNGDVTVNHGGFDVWLVKLSATGGLQWQKSYGGSNDDNGAAVVQTADGGYLVSANAGSNDGDVTYTHGGNNDYWVIKVNDTGRIQWQKTYGGSSDDNVTDETGPGALQRTTDGGYVLAGWSNSTNGDVTGNHGSYDYWVVKISDTGRLEWQKSLGGTGDDEATAIVQSADGGYAVGGLTISNDGDVSGNHGNYDYWVVKISDTGHLQWQICMGGANYVPDDCINSLIAATGGGYIVAGFTNSTNFDVTDNHGDYDAWVVKLNCTMPVNGPITGPSQLCVGATITLADTAAAGIWRASNSHVSVTAGIVTGASAGVDTISYSIANTCGGVAATKAVTVNPLPVPVVTLTGYTFSTAATYITYQWQHNGTAIAGATTNTFTYTSIGWGVYAVTVTDSNGCTGTSANDTIRYMGIGAVHDTKTAAGVTIHPNPATDRIYITAPETTTAHLTNMLGETVFTSTGDIINIAALPPGVYLITLTSKDGEVLLRDKVIKW